jgi:hypothetical protein
MNRRWADSSEEEHLVLIHRKMPVSKDAQKRFIVTEEHLEEIPLSRMAWEDNEPRGCSFARTQGDACLNRAVHLAHLEPTENVLDVVATLGGVIGR